MLSEYGKHDLGEQAAESKAQKGCQHGQKQAPENKYVIFISSERSLHGRTNAKIKEKHDDGKDSQGFRRHKYPTEDSPNLTVQEDLTGVKRQEIQENGIN